VSGAHRRGFAPAGPHFKFAAMASRLQRVEDLIDWECEPHTSRSSSRRLALVCVSGWLTWIVVDILV